MPIEITHWGIKNDPIFIKWSKSLGISVKNITEDYKIIKEIYKSRKPEISESELESLCKRNLYLEYRKRFSRSGQHPYRRRPIDYWRDRLPF